MQSYRIVRALPPRTPAEKLNEKLEAEREATAQMKALVRGMTLLEAEQHIGAAQAELTRELLAGKIGPLQRWQLGKKLDDLLNYRKAFGGLIAASKQGQENPHVSHNASVCPGADNRIAGRRVQLKSSAYAISGIYRRHA